MFYHNKLPISNYQIVHSRRSDFEIADDGKTAGDLNQHDITDH